MKYYIIAGEASGDLHASNLMKALKTKDPQAVFRCWGGDLMQEQGGIIVKHYRDLAFMGFVEVIANLKTILHNIDYCKTDILSFQPDAVILVDYPGFNLRIAEFTHQQKIKTIYYISPQVWAWKQSRVKKIKRDVDLMMVILPFEPDFYKKFDLKVVFTGHPLLDAINNRNQHSGLHNIKSSKPVIALLPGSRAQEIKVMLPLMLEAVKSFPGYQAIIAGAPSISKEFYKPFLSESTDIIYNQTYDLLEVAEAALVTSGTATLETALFNVPQVVCYKGNLLSYYIAKRLVNIKYISLVNLIMDEPVVTELIQNDLTIERIRNELGDILTNGKGRDKMLHKYEQLKVKLGGTGASERAASSIVKLLN